jgi:hypothetical protein
MVSIFESSFHLLYCFRPAAATTLQKPLLLESSHLVSIDTFLRTSAVSQDSPFKDKDNGNRGLFMGM